MNDGQSAVLRVRFAGKVLCAASVAGPDATITTAVHVAVFQPIDGPEWPEAQSMGELFQSTHALLIDLGGRWLTVALTWNSGFMMQGVHEGEEMVTRFMLLTARRLMALIGPGVSPDFIRAALLLFAGDLSQAQIQAEQFGVAQAQEPVQIDLCPEWTQPAQVAQAV